MEHDKFISQQKEIITNYEIGFIELSEMHNQLIALSLEVLQTNNLIGNADQKQ